LFPHSIYAWFGLRALESLMPAIVQLSFFYRAHLGLHCDQELNYLGAFKLVHLRQLI